MYWPSALQSFNEMDRLFGELSRLYGTRGPARGGYPQLNAWTNEDGVLVTMEVPGVEPESIDISIQDNVVTVAGEQPARERAEGESYHRRERRTGRFQRELTLPFRPNPDQVEASCRHGVLTVTFAKPEEEKPRKIAVKAA